MAYSKDYYVGLDIGTASVGWAVTDTSYKIIRGKGKDMWGARLFKEAGTAQGRRMQRVARRRRERETERISVLKSLFASEIKQVDPGFYQRLSESKYFLDDRSDGNQQKSAIFCEKNYTDADYFKEYPTIFHLRKELACPDGTHANSPMRKDVRLVYLALLNMFKHRGNFLNDNLDENSSSSFKDSWNELSKEYQDLFSSDEKIEAFPKAENVDELKHILDDKNSSKTAIFENVAKYLGVLKKDKRLYNILGLLCGCSQNLDAIFGKEKFEDAESSALTKISFRDNSFEEKIAELGEVVEEDDMSFVMAMKQVYDSIHDHIMCGKEFISEARVEAYAKHKEDLKLLKKTIRRLSPDEYDGMFREISSGSYSAYIGSTNTKKKYTDDGSGKQRRYVAGKKEDNYKPTAMYDKIKRIFKDFPEDPDVKKILWEIENKTFLKKQLTFENGVIPNQVYVHEMKAILKNAEKYLPFLSERDHSGYTVSEKVVELFQFHIPYYVGPLGKSGDPKKDHGWAVRKSNDKVYPWNFWSVIDRNKTSEAFIENLIGQCTYLSDQKVLPKKSLLYEKFMVLNELNNLKINSKPVSVELKQNIYNDLFMKGRPVKQKKLLDYLQTNGDISKENADQVSGIDGDFKAYLSSVGKFNGIFKSPYFDREHKKMIERIIYLGTVYGDLKDMFKARVKKEFGDRLDEKQIKRIMGFKFAGWGRMSRKFLELQGVFKEDGKENGVVRSIIQTMWETNDNLMQVLSSKYTYTEEIEKATLKRHKILSEWVPEDFDDMYLSAPVKRMTWQTIKILREIETIMGHAPKRVFVEMTRSDQKKGAQGRKKSRKDFFTKLYENIKDGEKDWNGEIEKLPKDKFRIKKVYLYYSQMGRSMYSGKSISLDDLLNNNDHYDIDHIYPRHFVKDDSLQNNLVLVEKTINSDKRDAPLNSNIQKECKGLWKELKEKGLITKEKYQRLIRTTPFTAEEKAEFVQRQVVETGQSAKVVTQILKESFPNETDVVFSKAGLVSDFRNEFGIYKCRSINDLHHAKDAYLNVVVGNAYFVKFTNNPLQFMRNAEGKENKNFYQYNLGNIGEFFKYSIRSQNETAWNANESGKEDTIQIVKGQVFKNTPIITRRSYMQSGELTGKDTIYPARNAKEKDYFPIKSSDERLCKVSRYGGRKDIKTACYCLIEYKTGRKVQRSLEAIPSFLIKNNEFDEKVVYTYLLDSVTRESKEEITDFSLRKPKILFNSLFKIEGYYYCLAGRTGDYIILHNAVPLLFNNQESLYVKKIDKAVKTQNYDEKDRNKNPILTEEKNIKFYNTIVEKLSKNIFRNKKGKLCELVFSGKEKFANLSLPKQCTSIQEILLGFAANTNPVNLSDIGGSKKAGEAKIKKNITDLKECVLIHQSVTGLVETREDLLTI